MKILYVTSDNSAISGAFRSCAKLAKHMKEEFKENVKVVVPSDGNGVELLDEYEVEHVLVKSRNWICRVGFNARDFLKKILFPVFNFFNSFAIKKFLKKETPDIVHINTSYSYMFAKVAYKLGIPVVWHLREFLEEDQNNRFFNKKAAIKTISKANKVIAISNSLNKKYSDVLENIYTIYNGIDAQEYSNDKEKFQSQTINLLCVGSVIPKKGQEQVIEVLGILKNNKTIDNNFVLRLAGLCSDDYKLKLKMMVEKYNLNNNVKFLGGVKNTKQLYEQSDISFVNSYMEAFGRVTVESMMAGCLVIGADSGATSEIISDKVNGLLFERGNKEAIKKAIEYAFNNKEQCKEIAKIGKRDALEKYTSIKNASEIHKVYQEILNFKSQRR